MSETDPDFELRWVLELAIANPLAKAGIRTVQDLRDRMDAVRAGEVRGVGPRRVAIIEEVLAYL